jgi:metacaspase-1
LADEPLVPATGLRDGDVLLFHGRSTLSKLIRLFDGTDVSHAGLYRAGGTVAEALGKGLTRRDLPTSVKDNDWVRVMRHEPDLADLGPVARRCDEYLDVPHRYGYEQILLLAFLGATRHVPVNGFLASLLRHLLDGAAEVIARLTSGRQEPMICSEFVYRCYQEADPRSDDPFSLIIDFARGKRARMDTRVESGSLLELALATPAPRARAVGHAQAPIRYSLKKVEAVASRYLAANESRGRARGRETLPLEELRPSLLRFARAVASRRSRPIKRGGLTDASALKGLKGAVADFVTPGDLLCSPSLDRIGRLDKNSAPTVVRTGAVRGRALRSRGRGKIMPKGLALCIGLNSVDGKHYDGWTGPLDACEADAQDMASLARGQGFTVTSLLTRKATRKAVLAAAGQAAKKLKAGDLFFLTYSGHGGQLPDKDGDEPDLKDETWCLYDGELIDDELSALWSKFAPGVRVLVLSDSCHSGSVTREAYDRLASSGALNEPASAGHQGGRHVFRAMPDEVALRTYRKNRAFYDKLMSSLPKRAPSVRCTVRLISGCQDNQLSEDGTFNGRFTGTLLRVWDGGRFNGDYTAFHKAIRRRMPPYQSPNHFMIGVSDPDYDHQKPFTI